MLKWFKTLSGAIVLAALAVPLGAQQLGTVREAPPQTAPKKVDLRPKYLAVRGRVLMRSDKNGVTRYGYENGRLVKEIGQNDVVGTYQYDGGKFSGVVYTDGRYIKASYGPNGEMLGLTSDTSARVKFRVQNKPTRVTSFMAIQNGIAALRNPGAANYCVGTDDDETCTIVVEGTRPDGDELDDGGWDGGGYTWGNDFPPAREMPSGGGDVSNPPGENPEDCIQNVCKPASQNMGQYCLIIAPNNPDTWKKCNDKATDYYWKCKDSCHTNNWAWLNWWVFSW
ncbi:hypothetical protein SRABI118_01384 [Massilia sp. Bi118]|uniref:hypothetical protein n=1 Tax=Massilia sp. Bi118 TaxID=2822346 RepID=UPI001DEB04DD|nr:hypothetical protein [Massilia sp. Bi118]CAH0186543.1 hypothetical protein SRABI118_01384 [Massilia sp. Bi118]